MSPPRQLTLLRWMFAVAVALVLASLVGMLIFGPRVGIWGPGAIGVLMSIAFGYALMDGNKRRRDTGGGAP